MAMLPPKRSPMRKSENFMSTPSDAGVIAYFQKDYHLHRVNPDGCVSSLSVLWGNHQVRELIIGEAVPKIEHGTANA
jgi:hypothetical protein